MNDRKPANRFLTWPRLLTISTIVSPALVGVAMIVGGCGNGDSGKTASTTGGAASGLSGTVSIDGSTTVFPIANAMGEDFMKANSSVKVVVDKAGTGSGMQKFERGEIDIATASRPIKADEADACKKAGIEFVEVPIAFDAVCVIVNTGNSFVKSFTPPELYQAWNLASTVKTWKDWNSVWPAEKINFYGPSDNHGTYEYFTEAIDKKKGDIRKDYQPTQDYNVIVQDVAGDRNGIGYVGLNYYVENKDKVHVVPIDSGKGPVTPSEQTVLDGTYSPLSRPLFLYVSKKALARPEIAAFVNFALGDEGSSDVKESDYVALPAESLATIKKRTDAGITGSLFMNVPPGTPMSQVLSKEATAK